LSAAKAGAIRKLARSSRISLSLDPGYLLPATFFLACLAALELDGVALEEI